MLLQKVAKTETRNTNFRIIPQEDLFRFRDYNRIVIPMAKGAIILKFEEILYCKASSNYTEIHTISGQNILLSKTLKWTSSKLDTTFRRVHKSFLINLLAIKKYDSLKNKIYLTNGDEIPVSRALKPKVAQFFK